MHVYIQCDGHNVFRRLFNRSGGRVRTSLRTVGAVKNLLASGIITLRNLPTLQQVLEMLCPFRSTFDLAPVSSPTVKRNRIERPSSYTEEKLVTGLYCTSSSKTPQTPCSDDLGFMFEVHFVFEKQFNA